MVFEKNASTPFYDRFEEAFKREAQVFVDCVMNGKPYPITTKDGLATTVVAEACTLSFKEKRVVWVDEI